MIHVVDAEAIAAIVQAPKPAYTGGVPASRNARHR